MLSGRRYSCIVDELHLVGRASGVFAASAGADLCGPGIIACRNRPASPEPYLPVSNTTKAPPNSEAFARPRELRLDGREKYRLCPGRCVLRQIREFRISVAYVQKDPAFVLA